MKRVFLTLVLLCALYSPAWAAISFVNAGTASSAASGDITLNSPATPQNGDVWIAACHSSDNVAHTLTDWTELINANGVNASTHLSVWRFVYAGSTPNLILGHTAGNTVVCGIAAFRTVDNTTPIDTTGATNSESGGGSTTVEHTSITPSAENTMVLAINGSANDINRTTLPADFAAAFEPSGTGSGANVYKSAAGTTDGSVALHYKAHTSGATGAIVDTQTSVAVYTSVLIALNPAAADPASRRRAGPVVFQ